MSLGWNAAAGDSARQYEQGRNVDKMTRSNKADIRAEGYGDYGDTARNQRGDVTDKYWNLFNQAGADEGGGPGAYTPNVVRYNEAMDGYRELARTGGWTPEDIASAQSIASASGEGLYQGLKNQMLRSSAGAGVPVYSGTLSKMSRDSAQQANRSNMESNMNIQSDIRNRKETGLSGVGQYDTEFMNATERENSRRNAHSSAVAGYGSARAAARRREQASYLSDIAGLNNDIPYYNLREGTYGAGTDILNSQKNPHDSTRV